MEELWGQITLRATVIVHNCASYVQCSAEVNGPVPVQIILPSHVLDSWTNPCAREEKAVNLHTYNPIPGSTYHMTEPALDFQGIGNPQSSQLHHLNPCSFTSTLQPFKCGNNLIWQHLPTQQKSTHQKGTVRTQQGCSCFHSTPHCRSSKKNGTIILQQYCPPCNTLLPEAAPHSDSGPCQLCCRSSIFFAAQPNASSIFQPCLCIPHY